MQNKILYTEDKIHRLYRYLCYLTYPGVLVLIYLIYLIFPAGCVGIFRSGIGCVLAETIGWILGISLMIGAGGIPFLIYIVLITFSTSNNPIELKYLVSGPFFLLFFFLLAVFLLIIDRNGLFLVIVFAALLVWVGVFFVDGKNDNERSPIFIPPSRSELSTLLEQEFFKIDISNVDYIYFHENLGKSYKISLNSIKTIAVYFYQKSNKTTFVAGELSEESDFLLKNYPSNLSIKDYNKLVHHLGNWIMTGGSFDIVYK